MSIPQQGWYPDPDSPALVRWWDGEKWTEHTQPHPHYAGNNSSAEASQGAAEASVASSGEAAVSAEVATPQVAEVEEPVDAAAFGNAAEQALASDSVAAVDAQQDQTVQVAAELFRDAQWSAAEAKKDITEDAGEAVSSVPQAAQDFIGQGDAHQVAEDATAAWPQVDGSALSGHVDDAVQQAEDSASEGASALPGAAALAGLGGAGAAARSAADGHRDDISSAIRERQQSMEAAVNDAGVTPHSDASSATPSEQPQAAAATPAHFTASEQAESHAPSESTSRSSEGHEVQSAVPRAGRERRARRQAAAEAADPLVALQRPSQSPSTASGSESAKPQQEPSQQSAAPASAVSSSLDDVTSLPGSPTLDRNDISSQEARLKEAEQEQRREVARLTDEVKSAEAAAETAKYELHLITEESSGEEKTLSDAIKLATREAELADQELQHAKSRLENANEELAKFTSIYQERQTAYERAESMAKEAASREQEVTERARKLLAETDEKRQAARKRLESAEEEVMTARSKLSQIAGLPVERFVELSEGGLPDALEAAEGAASQSTDDSDASSAGYVSGSVTVPGKAMMLDAASADDAPHSLESAAEPKASDEDLAVVTEDVVEAEVVSSEPAGADDSDGRDVSDLPVVPLASEPEAFDESAPSPPSMRPMQDALAQQKGGEQAPADRSVVTAEIVTNDSQSGGTASAGQGSSDAPSDSAGNFASFIGGTHGTSADTPAGDAPVTPPGDEAAHASTADSMGASWPGASEDRIVDLRGVEEELSVGTAAPSTPAPGIVTPGGASDFSGSSAPSHMSMPPAPEVSPTEAFGQDAAFATPAPAAPQVPAAAPTAPAEPQPVAEQADFADPARPFAPSTPVGNDPAQASPQQEFGFASPSTPAAPSIPQPPVGTYAMEVKHDDAPAAQAAPSSQPTLPPMPAAAAGVAGGAALGAMAAPGQQAPQQSQAPSPAEAPSAQNADGWAGRETIQESSKPQPHKLASRTQRLAAYVIDSIVLTLPVLVVMGIFGSEMTTYMQKLAVAPADGVAYLLSQGGMLFSFIVVSLILPWLYDGLLPAFTGGTFGHKLFGLRVMPDTSETRNLDVSTCLVRGLIKRPLFSMFPAILIFGFLWCFWQSYRQCWHDSAAHSVVTSTR